MVTFRRKIISTPLRRRRVVRGEVRRSVPRPKVIIGAPILNRRTYLKRAQARVKRLNRVTNNPQNTMLNMNKLARTTVEPTPGRSKAVGAGRITQAGEAFLKCAFAPPDFTSTQVQGIVDNFRGNSLLKKHRFTDAFTMSAGNDYYFLLLPVPGVACFSFTTTSGTPFVLTDNFAAVHYSDFQSCFTNSVDTTTANFESFRFVSNHFELIPTVNEMSWSGSITAFKTPIKFVQKQRQYVDPVTNYGGDIWTIQGLDAVNGTNGQQYNGPYNAGVYSGCYNNSTEFEFSNIMENMSNVPTSLGPADYGYLYNGLLPFTGFDNSFECLVVRIQGITTTNTCLIKTWACVEYSVKVGSTLYEYQTTSPPLDAYAMRIYRETILSLPVAVSYHENANFWQRVLTIIRSLTGVGAMLPGAYGTVSRGANLLASGIQTLTM